MSKRLKLYIGSKKECRILKQKPLITVIVLSYNSPDLFCALDSVLLQDYPRIQLILTDDSSERFSRKETEQYVMLNKRDNLEETLILVNSENQGTVHSLNTALKHSRGVYIFNLAGDDCFYDEHVLSDWVEAFEQSGAQIITARRAVCNERLELIGREEPSNEQIKMIREYEPKQLFEKIAERNFIFGCCTARSAESFLKYGTYDEDYRLIEDHPTNLKLLRQGIPVTFFDRIVIRYRGGGISTPMRYNEYYLRDVNLVLEKEVLPYTAHPIRMRSAFRNWKRDQVLLKKRDFALQKYAGSKVMRLAIRIWYYLHHPVRILRKLGCGSGLRIGKELYKRWR